MNKIHICVEKECLTFSTYHKTIKEENLNNTNVINVKKLIFTDDYIIQNIDLVSTFINLILLKYKIDKVIINNLEIGETVLTLINQLSNIKYINFSEDKTLTYTLSSLLLENIYIEKIECYSLPVIMLYRFNKNIIQTRCEILSKSSFIKMNDINTFSDVFNKEKIVLFDYLTKEDVVDLICFLNTNNNLKKIEFRKYNRKNLEATLELLKKNNLKKINILIYESEETISMILEDIKLFEKYNKQYNVKIKIKYSNKYKQKNKIKELNIKILKIITLTSLILGLLLFFRYKILEKNNNNEIKNNLEEINKVVEGVQNKETIDTSLNDKEETIVSNDEYISSYYQSYSKVYDELIKLNSDTVGWLTVNGTKINYPVVQSSDNDYYLNRAYDKSSNSIGWIFVDYRNNMNDLSKNTIIYGHSMVKGGLMFSTLKNVLNSEWYNNPDNLVVSFNVKGVEYKWKVFSVYSIEETTDYLYSDFINESSFMNFIDIIKKRSINDFNTSINSTDKILTLSTCYKDNNHRLVLHAVKISN